MPDNELTETERRIAMAMTTGRLVDLRQTSAPVRAAVLVKLLDEAADTAVALRVRGARIVGHLNLGGRHIPIPVDLRECHFTGKILLAKSRVPELSLRGSHCPHGVSARGLRVDGALNLLYVRMDATLHLKRLRAEIVFLDGARLTGATVALQLRGAEIAQELYCGRTFSAHGTVNLYAARIGGQLKLDGATIHGGQGGALILFNASIGQDLRLRGVKASGELYLSKVKVGGNLEMQSLAVSNPGDTALNASMIEVEQNVRMDDGFSAIGEVSFFLGRVGGRVQVDGSWLSNPGGVALDVSRCRIAQSLLLNDLAAEGTISVYGSDIAGQLSLNSATVINHDGLALEAGQCRVGQSLWIGRGTRLEGTVNLTNADVGNRFMLRDATVHRVDATDLSMDILDDEPDCWPTGSGIGGMTYRSLPEDGRGQVSQRTAWLARLLPHYTPQPYSQLVKVYRELGNTSAARNVIIAQEAAHRRSHWNRAYRTVSRAWGGVLRWTIGYGYAPWRVVPWMMGLFLTAWLVFSTKGAFETANALTARGIQPQDFRPELHALDTILPVIALDSDSQWDAVGGFAWWEAGFACGGWFFSLLAAAGVAGVFKRE